MEWTSYLTKMGQGEHDLGLIGWIGDNGDPDNFLFLLSGDAAKKPANNYSFLRDKQFDELFLKGKKVVDPAERTAIYEKAQMRAGELAPWVPLVHAQVISAHARKVMEYVRTPTDQRRFHKTWLAQ
jgi:ABC-type transport system substrate-binding protein